MNISYRLIQESDVDDILEISNLSFKTPWSYDSIRSELFNPLAKYVVAVDTYSNKVIGFVGVWIIVGEGDITNIAVHPNYRGNKISNKLLDSLLELCLLENCSVLNLEVRESNVVAQSLYHNHGFIQVGKRAKYYEGCEDALLYTLNIKR